MPFLITKSDGTQEPFDIKKFSRSLKRSGADKHTIDLLVNQLIKQKNLRTTKEIYRYALKQLSKLNTSLAARYNLKQALLTLGPTGFPFEKFVGHLYKAQGYQVTNDFIARGWCIEHEIDVVAHKDNQHLLIECKFHNTFQLKSDVKVTLYIYARFLDISKKLRNSKQHKAEEYKPIVFTNTQFTSNAITYAQCVGLSLIAWNYPRNKGLAHMVDSLGLHPITALTLINQKQKKQLITQGFVLCKDVKTYQNELKKFGFSQRKIDKIIQQAEGVCHVP